MNKHTRKPLELRVYQIDPIDPSIVVIDGFWEYRPYDLSKRLTDAELAAEFHAFVMTDHKYPEDPDDYGDEEWEAYSHEYQEAEKTILRFATLPHYDEAGA